MAHYSTILLARKANKFHIFSSKIHATQPKKKKNTKHIHQVEPPPLIRREWRMWL
jgi:hypothetical protein